MSMRYKRSRRSFLQGSRMRPWESRRLSGIWAHAMHPYELDGKSEVDTVSVGYQVFLAFQAHLPFVLGVVPGAERAN